MIAFCILDFRPFNTLDFFFFSFFGVPVSREAFRVHKLPEPSESHTFPWIFQILTLPLYFIGPFDPKAGRDLISFYRADLEQDRRIASSSASEGIHLINAVNSSIRIDETISVAVAGSVNEDACFLSF